MNLHDFPARVGHWVATRPTHTKVAFSVALSVFLIELAFRRFAPKSLAYKRWTAFFEAIGAVWSAVLLSIIYAIAVGPISLGMRLARRDLLDRALVKEPTWWRSHEANPLGPAAAARHQF